MAYAKEGELLPHLRSISAMLWSSSPKDKALSLVRSPKLASRQILDVFIDGAPSRNRTHDLMITNQLLFQLSYWGIGADSGNRTRVISLEG